MAAKPAKNAFPLSLLLLLSCIGLFPCWAEQCGRQAGGALCPNNLCCSQYGYCGSTSAYCTSGCQSQCRKPGGGGGGGGGGNGGGGGVASIITSDIFHKFLSQSQASGCPSNGFYTYNAFMSAASVYPAFGTTGSSVVQKRELAAFFANAAHETGSGCYVKEIDPSPELGQYYGRGPLQITGRSNYEAAGQALHFDGVNDPGIVARDPTISFKTAVWYWMTQHSPTCHSAITMGRGFGATINAINGGFECGASANHDEQNDRISLYTSFCSSLKVDPGPNLNC